MFGATCLIGAHRVGRPRLRQRKPCTVRHAVWCRLQHSRSPQLRSSNCPPRLPQVSWSCQRAMPCVPARNICLETSVRGDFGQGGSTDASPIQLPRHESARALLQSRRIHRRPIARAKRPEKWMGSQD
jgi:hypothetical protein